MEDLDKQEKIGLTRWRLILGKKAENQNIMNIIGIPVNVLGLAVKSSKKGGGKPRKGRRGSESKGMKKSNKNQGKTSDENGKKKSEEEKEGKGGGSQKGKKIDKTVQNAKFQALDDTLDFVYSAEKNERKAGLGDSQISIPKWIENVNEFFPQSAREILEKDLVKNSDIADLVSHPELFEKIEPSFEMVKTILSLKNMLSPKVKEAARKLVEKVVDEIKKKLIREVERHIVGAIKRNEHTPLKVYRNIDWKLSIRQNLKYYNPNLKKLIMAQPRFFSNERRKKMWQYIILVDESGSMADSVIYSVIMASIFATLPAIHTNLIIFDTQVVDLSDKIDDPVDILMNTQLGGGTDITLAVRYGQQLIKNPKKTIFIIISDFYEGRPETDLLKELRNLLEGGTKILGLASLGSDARPYYNKRFAQQIANLGIDVVAATPNEFPELLAKLMNKN